MTASPGSKESYIGVFLEDILYGVYLSVFIESCVLVWKKHQERDMKNTYIMVTTFLMFLFITARCVIDNFRCIVALDNTGLDFGTVNNTLGVLTNTCWGLATAVADAFIIFRTFTVWNRNWFVIILPSMLFLGNVGTAIWLIVAFVKYDPTIETIFFLAQPITGFLALSLCTNLLCTGLISFRIFYFHRQVFGLLSPGSDVTRVISVIVESASLIANSLGSYVNYILFDCTPPTIGLVTGISYGESTESKSIAIDSQGRQNSPAFEIGSNRNVRSGTQSEVQVRLERVTHHRRDVDTSSKDDQSKYTAVPGV
ncbi:hypothetical protein C8R44DRAFT_745952 [Mycena epipterygia]|nr:hypothetical protein C8R44DRAFT_745952 [Mycena epipterygia]